MADLNRVLQVLKENNVDDKAIGQFVTGLNNMLAQQLEIEIVTTLGEKDFEKLNKLPETQAHAEIVKRYKEITSVPIEQKSQEILNGFVTGFLTEYRQGKPPRKEGK